MSEGMKKLYVNERPEPTTSRPPERGRIAEGERMTKVTLTPEQIENWRQVLCILIGPYALIMPVEMVQACKDKLQAQVDNADEESEK